MPLYGEVKNVSGQWSISGNVAALYCIYNILFNIQTFCSQTPLQYFKQTSTQMSTTSLT